MFRGLHQTTSHPTPWHFKYHSKVGVTISSQRAFAHSVTSHVPFLGFRRSSQRRISGRMEAKVARMAIVAAARPPPLAKPRQNSQGVHECNVQER